MTTIRVVAHCLLDPETRLAGLGPVAFNPVPPLIQLLCPEAGCLGLDRWAVTKTRSTSPPTADTAARSSSTTQI